MNITLPEGLVCGIDDYVRRRGLTRSAFLAKAARQALRHPAADPESFMEALRAVDPSWSGKKPAVRTPLEVRTRSGVEPVELVQAAKREELRTGP